MTEKISEKLKGGKPEDIEELILDGIKASTISGLTEEFKMLRSLSIINTGLVSLDGLPYLPNLEELELSDNKLNGGFDIIVKQCPKLWRLHLSGNRIKSIDTIKCLSKLESLKFLDLINCEVTLMKDYRRLVFEIFPNLVGLDGWDNMDAEVDESAEESLASEEEDGSSESEVEVSGSSDLEPIEGELDEKGDSATDSSDGESAEEEGAEDVENHHNEEKGSLDAIGGAIQETDEAGEDEEAEPHESRKRSVEGELDDSNEAKAQEKRQRRD